MTQIPPPSLAFEAAEIVNITPWGNLYQIQIARLGPPSESCRSGKSQYTAIGKYIYQIQIARLGGGPESCRFGEILRYIPIGKSI